MFCNRDSHKVIILFCQRHQTIWLSIVCSCSASVVSIFNFIIFFDFCVTWFGSSCTKRPNHHIVIILRALPHDSWFVGIIEFRIFTLWRWRFVDQVISATPQLFIITLFLTCFTSVQLNIALSPCGNYDYVITCAALVCAQMKTGGWLQFIFQDVITFSAYAFSSTSSSSLQHEYTVHIIFTSPYKWRLLLTWAENWNSRTSGWVLEIHKCVLV